MDPTQITNYVVTANGRTLSLLNYVVANPVTYCCIGKPTPWPDDEQPPFPGDSLVVLPEPLIYVRCPIVGAALPTDCAGPSDVVCGDTSYRIYDVRELLVGGTHFEVHPTHLYFECAIRTEDYVGAAWRAVSLHAGVVLKPSADPLATSYLPEQLTSTGVLLWAAYCTPVQHLDETDHIIRVMVSL